MNYIYFINNVILWYFVMVCFCYIILLFGSLKDIFNKFQEVSYGDINDLMKSENSIPVTIIVPMYNEEKNILNTIESILNNTYKNVFIIVVNDSSTDNTLSLLKMHYHLQETAYIMEEKIVTSKVKHYFISKKKSEIARYR